MSPLFGENGLPDAQQKQLLRACLLSSSFAQEAWKEWREQIDFDQIDHASYKLLPLVSRRLDLFQDPIFEKCKGVYRRTWATNRIHWEKILPYLDRLRQAGVTKIILLKGMAMILEYYRDFGVRVIGDIDILVPKAELPIVNTVLSQSGWKQKASRIDMENPDHLNRWHALNFTHPHEMELDIHWSLIEENCSALDESAFQHAKPLSIRGIALYVPSPTDLLLQTCIHGIKPSPVPLIRWIADAMTIFKHSEKEIDWNRLVKLANEARVDIPLALAFQYLTQEFNAPIPSHIIQQLKTTPVARLQSREYIAYSCKNLHRAAWYRYCLNRNYLTFGSQIVQLPRYLQITARLKSPWQIPFYGVYWILKRVYRLLKKSFVFRKKKAAVS